MNVDFDYSLLLVIKYDKHYFWLYLSLESQCPTFTITVSLQDFEYDKNGVISLQQVLHLQAYFVYCSVLFFWTQSYSFTHLQYFIMIGHHFFIRQVFKIPK